MHQMRTRLLAVAHELESEMTDADEPTTSAEPSSSMSLTGDTSRQDAPVDPRYEDLWVSPAPNEAVDIPDLASIDLDVDDESDPPA
jgi:hypothetical protein